MASNILENREIGFILIPSFLSPDMTADLILELDQNAVSQGWENTGNSNSRRVQQFLHRYNYRSTAANQKAPDPFLFLKSLALHLYSEQIFEKPVEQIIVNEYTRKQGIGAHIDSSTFGPVIASIFLGSEVLMKFSNSSNGHSFELLLQNGSLLIFWGAARYSYSHQISSNVTYIVNGSKHKREQDFRRISCIFRTWV
jgi:alkylated DNA repair dioxygenase AlkB